MAVSGKNLARWYREVSQHLRAGLPMPKALEMGGGVPKRDRRRLAEELRAGESMDGMLENAPRWMPEVDRRVLSSAAHSGQMVETLLVLSEKHAFSAGQARRAAGAVVYPFFVIHVAIFVLPILVIGIESAQAYGRMVLSLLLPLWAVILFVVWSIRSRHRWVRLLMGLMPLLRGYLKARAVADLSFALRAYLVAGETVDVAWAGAALASGDRRLRRFGEAVAEKARRGFAPSEEVVTASLLPEDFVSLYQTGEQTGQLDENLHHLWKLYDEMATEKLRAATFWYPMLLLMLVAIGVAYFIITAYVRYLEGILDML